MDVVVENVDVVVKKFNVVVENFDVVVKNVDVVVENIDVLLKNVDVVVEKVDDDVLAAYLRQVMCIADGAAVYSSQKPAPRVRSESGGIRNGSIVHERNPAARKASS